MLAQEHVLDVASVYGHSLHADFDVVQLDGEISKNIATDPASSRQGRNHRCIHFSFPVGALSSPSCVFLLKSFRMFVSNLNLSICTRALIKFPGFAQ